MPRLRGWRLVTSEAMEVRVQLLGASTFVKSTPRSARASKAGELASGKP
jgi:hypothetical protein